MCERYSITALSEDIETKFSVIVPAYYKPRYNAAPSQLLPVITSQSPDGLSYFYWGLSPERSKNKTISERIINFRSEVVADKPVFRRALMTRRCLVPADGYYEWKRLGKKTIIPYRLTLTTKSIFSFAGLWEEFETEKGEMHHTFSILTTSSNSVVATLHDRMPVILHEKNAEKTWLNPTSSENDLLKLLKPIDSDKIEFYSVSPGINTQNMDVPSMIIPVPPADQHGNLTLFG